MLKISARLFILSIAMLFCSQQSWTMGPERPNGPNIPYGKTTHWEVMNGFSQLQYFKDQGINVWLRRPIDLFVTLETLTNPNNRNNPLNADDVHCFENIIRPKMRLLLQIDRRLQELHDGGGC